MKTEFSEQKRIFAASKLQRDNHNADAQLESRDVWKQEGFFKTFSLYNLLSVSLQVVKKNRKNHYSQYIFVAICWDGGWLRNLKKNKLYVFEKDWIKNHVEKRFIFKTVGSIWTNGWWRVFLLYFIKKQT